MAFIYPLKINNTHKLNKLIKDLAIFAILLCTSAIAQSDSGVDSGAIKDDDPACKEIAEIIQENIATKAGEESDFTLATKGAEGYVLIHKEDNYVLKISRLQDGALVHKEKEVAVEIQKRLDTSTKQQLFAIPFSEKPQNSGECFRKTSSYFNYVYFTKIIGDDLRKGISYIKFTDDIQKHLFFISELYAIFVLFNQAQFIHGDLGPQNIKVVENHNMAGKWRTTNKFCYRIEGIWCTKETITAYKIPVIFDYGWSKNLTDSEDPININFTEWYQIEAHCRGLGYEAINCEPINITTEFAKGVTIYKKDIPDYRSKFSTEIRSFLHRLFTSSQAHFEKVTNDLCSEKANCILLDFTTYSE